MTSRASSAAPLSRAPLRAYGALARDEEAAAVVLTHSARPSTARTSWRQRLFFTEAADIVATTQQRLLTFDDLLPLEPQDRTATCYDVFDRVYELSAGSARRRLFRALCASYAPTLALCALGQLVTTCCSVFAPIVVQRVVLAFSTELDVVSLLQWLALFFASRLASVLVGTQVFDSLSHVALRLMSALRSLLFRKAMRRGFASSQSHAADLLNLATSDASNVLAAVQRLTTVWLLPIQIGAVTFLLFSVLDVAAFAGVAVVIASLLLNSFAARVMNRAYARLLQLKDVRMRTVRQVFGAIQIVKLNAWEARFQRRLETQRLQELRELTAFCYAGACSAFVLWTSPLLVSSVSFAVYALVLERELSAATVFTSMALFNVLRDPLRDLPSTVQFLVQTRLSFHRIARFLELPEYERDSVESMPRCHDPDASAPAITVADASFTWSESHHADTERTRVASSSRDILHGISLHVQAGHLVVVSGRVGAGKSSLCSALLGEMHKRSGRVRVFGSTAYVAQTPCDPALLDAGRLVDTETRFTGDVSGSVWTQYVHSIGGWRIIALLFASQMLWQLFQIGSDVWLSRATSSSARSPASSEDQVARSTHVVAVYVALVSACALMVLVRGVIVSWMGLRASKTLFAAMTNALLRAPLRFFDQNPIGRIITRFGDDFTFIDRAIPTAIGLFVTAAFAMASALLTSALSIRWLGVALVPMLWLYVRLARQYVRAFCELMRLRKLGLAPILSHITQSERGVATIRAFGDASVARAIAEMEHHVDQNGALWRTEIVVIQWFKQRMQFLGCAVLAVVLGAVLLFHGLLSAGTVGLVFTYALSVDGALVSLMNMWSRSENAMVSVERVLEYSALEPERTPMATAVPASWPEHGTIAFESVHFGYSRDRSRSKSSTSSGALVLHGVSFAVRAGEKIGIVGRTGAGKSSLTMALFRINELRSGRILVGGRDIARVPLGDLRARLSIIPQSPVLLEGSLRGFLDPLDDFPDHELLRVLRSVGLMDVLGALVHGGRVLAVELRAQGDNFSVGERQLLCMARALLKQTKIVVMDEATAAMDQTTERRLADVVRRELHGVTLLTIAHRLATVIDADRILVLRDGRVVEFDTPTALQDKTDGVFATMMRERKGSVKTA